MSYEAILEASRTKIQDIARGRRYSDLVDDEGRQYVDLVLEGGGTLGIALAGYVSALEEAGIRFLGIAGTSAGAVTAAVLAAGGDPSESRAAYVRDKLDAMNMWSFVDGAGADDADARRMTNAIVARTGSGPFDLWKWWSKAALAAVAVLDNFKLQDGLNRGDNFAQWIDDATKNLTAEDLRKQMSRVTLKVHREGKNQLEQFSEEELATRGYRLDGAQWVYTPPRETDLLGIVAADLSTGTRLLLPKMSDLLFSPHIQPTIGQFVRASMSIPGFFAPVRLPKRAEPSYNDAWKRHFNTAPIVPPGKHCLVDGGVLSNFPIGIFHNPNVVPLRPTFGAKLQMDGRGVEVRGLRSILWHSFNTARHAMDCQFIEENPDFSHLVVNIDTGDAHWLDFEMSLATKETLFSAGVDTAVSFLRRFDWNEYKRVRQHLREARRGISAVNVAPPPAQG